MDKDERSYGGGFPPIGLVPLVERVTALPPPPSRIYPGLFAHIAQSNSLVETKVFADSTPRAAPEKILATYQSEMPATEGEIRAFVDRWFEPPAGATEPTRLDRPTMCEWIESLWSHLTRGPDQPRPFSSLVALPNRYVVPGGIFRECYYWDTYFTLTGFGADRSHLREACVANLADQIDRFGFVPNGNRTYYLSRSQPPTFYAAVADLNPEHPEQAWARYLPQLLREHAYWMSGETVAGAGEAANCVVALSDGAILNRYWDDLAMPRDEAAYGRDVLVARDAYERPPADVYRDIRAACASGWDFSSRWFSDRRTMATIRTTSVVPVDLNALIFGLESAIEAAAKFLENVLIEKEFRQRAEARRNAMTRWLWNDRLGLFDDFDVAADTLRDAVTPASLFPLFAGLATNEQAVRTGARIADDLLTSGGLVTSSIDTGEQWDAPNGWAPLQWVAVVGLKRYKQDDLAAEIARRWVTTVARVYKQTGRMMEKYDVVAERPGGGGEYPLQDGFGWTNGVTLALIRLYPELAELGSTRPSSIAAPPQ